MIATTSKIMGKECPFKQGRGEYVVGRCSGSSCALWEYYVPPAELAGKPHGLKDFEKKGYCGLVGSRR